MDDFNLERLAELVSLSVTYPERTISALLAIGVISTLLGVGMVFSRDNLIVAVFLIIIGVAFLLYATRIVREVRRTGDHIWPVSDKDLN